MYEKVSEKQVGKDLVTLFLYHSPEHVNPVSRYVFQVDGPRASGMGQVGAGVYFVKHNTDRNGVSFKASALIDDLESVPDIQVYADAHCMGQYTPETDGITLNGAAYEYGRAWERHPGQDAWHTVHGGLVRVNGKMTEAGHDRIVAILDAARDLFMAIPDIETQLVRRALTEKSQATLVEMEQAKDRIVRLNKKLRALDEG